MRRLVRLELPVARDPEPVRPELEGVGGREPPDAGEERLVPLVEIPLLEVVANGAQVRLARAEDPRLAREREPCACAAVVERLDPEAVARGEQRSPFRVPDCERPHAVEPLDAARSPFAVAGEQDLRVGLRPEDVTFAAKLLAKLEVVVDLAVEDQLVAAVVARERLEARVGEVDDREPEVAEADAVVAEDTAAVGPAVRQPVEHLLDVVARWRGGEVDDTAEAAHQTVLRRPASVYAAPATRFAIRRARGDSTYRLMSSGDTSRPPFRRLTRRRSGQNSFQSRIVFASS